MKFYYLFVDNFISLTHHYISTSMPAYNGGLRAELPVGSRGRAPGQRIRGQSLAKVRWTCPPKSTPCRRPGCTKTAPSDTVHGHSKRDVWRTKIVW